VPGSVADSQRLDTGRDQALDPANVYQWRTLDKDLNRISRVEYGTQYVSRPLVGLGISLAFIVIATLTAALVFGQESGTIVVAAAAAFGAYMALNIGANDVANNMGPAVGANALTLGGAIAIAAICESAGALLAGGDVVSTISQGIVEPSSLGDARVLTWAMMSALLAAAIWVNIATWLGAPVSTTHAVVGGVLGAGVAAAGVAAVNWQTMSAIMASWVISPVMGGAVAALFLAFIKAKIIYVDDKITAARRWVPVLIALMAGIFAAYLALKGLRAVVTIGLGQALWIGAGATFVSYAISVPLIRRQSAGMENRNRSLKALFGVPLVISAGLLSFAHGANDVANAVGPLAAIVHAQQSGGFAAQVHIPVWVMVIGAFGISFGLVLFGPTVNCA
jgi:PiT family inorganic phosphate transporter